MNSILFNSYSEAKYWISCNEHYVDILKIETVGNRILIVYRTN